MTITIENTAVFVEINGVTARLWEGRTASGIRVHCFVVRLGVPVDADHAAFQRELIETRAPSPGVYPARLVL